MSSFQCSGNNGDRNALNSSATRRQALGAVAMGTTGALMFPHMLEGYSVNSQTTPLMLRMDSAQWSRFIGKTFSAVNREEGRVQTLRLEEVLDDAGLNTNKPPGCRQTAISLIFSTCTIIADNNYLVRHSKLGSAELYVHATRRGERAEKIRYQAILN